MISPTKTAGHVITDGLPGERRAFTIKATGKAFRTLIDGLYENKIGAVTREIISNGYDSHAAAGTPEVPLSITAPTNMDPTFRVRDYGVSMSHETIMDLYTTIFHSTKENTNDEVGQFGLGSKSPFAYTDTFSITAFLDGEKRVYVAHISDDDVPQITHLVTEPQEDEPNGVEVAIPVKPSDVSRFHKEISKMILGSDVIPEVDGLPQNVRIPVVHEGGDWRIIKDIFSWGSVAVRQGCVIYPVHSRRVDGVAYGYTAIIDVPIGSVDVTASRESLSLTPASETYLNHAVRDTSVKVKDFADVLNASFKNRLDAYQGRFQNDWLSIKVGRADVKLNLDKPNKNVLAQSIEVMHSQRSTSWLSAFGDIRKIILVVDDPIAHKSVPRKKARIKALYSQYRYQRQIAIVTRAELPRLVRLFGLSATQVISVAALPDVMSTSTAGTRKSQAGKFAAPKAFPAGKYWFRKTGASGIYFNIGGVYASRSDELFCRANAEVFNTLGFKVDDVVFLTDRQAEALAAPENQEFTKALKAAAEVFNKKHKVEDKVYLHNKHRALYDATDSYHFVLGLRKRYNIGGFNEILGEVSLAAADKARTELGVSTSHPKTPSLVETFVAGILELDVEYDLQKSNVQAKLDAVIEFYGDLFTGNNASIRHLVNFYTTIQEEKNK